MDRKLYNQKRTLRRRRELRADPTPFEKMLWYEIRSSQLGYKFRRQQGIGPYIADFYCPRVKLVIEIDGDSHFSRDGLMHDEKRDCYFTQNGIRVLRFTNIDIQESIEGVIEVIRKQLLDLSK